MTSPSRADIEAKIWKYAVATHCFDEALIIIEKMKNLKPKPELGLHEREIYHLSIALVVLYAKPFKQKKSFRIIEDLVPKYYRETHEFMLLMRDKVIAHSDPDGPVYQLDRKANDIHLEIENGRIVGASLSTLLIRERELDNIEVLIKELLKKAAYHVEKNWNKINRKDRSNNFNKIKISI